MGQELTTLYSSLSSTPPPARGDVVFVVPLNLHLTARQMNEMVACGQQPGVPFSLTPEGVSRPSGNRAKVNFAENGVTLHRTSVKVFDEGGGMFSVSFKYDASCAAQVTVMIGNRDRTTAEVIKCDEPLIKWGPLPLGKGLNQEWSSKALGLFAKECMFPGRSRATGLGNDIHDIIISLSPFGSADDSQMMSGVSLLSHVTQQQQRHCQHSTKPKLQPQSQKQRESINNNSSSGISISTLPPNVLNSLTDWSILSGPGRGGIAVIGSVVGSSTGSTSSSSSSGNSNTNSPNIDDVMRQAQSSAYSLDNEIKSIAFQQSNCPPFSGTSNRNQVIREVSYIRVTAAGQVAPGAKRKESILDTALSTLTGLEGWDPAPIAVKCVMQRVQLPGCVFLTQDIYGMDRGVKKSSSSSSKSMTGLSSSSKDSAEGEEGNVAFDSDANECVVCLTDPRVVAVYPCRHMCLCASCATSLPSQQNKCPLCRRTAVLLLQIELPSASKNPEEVVL